MKINKLSDSFDGEKRILDTAEHGIYCSNETRAAMIKVFTVHLFDGNTPEASQLD
jgi:hypothetical protein